MLPEQPVGKYYVWIDKGGGNYEYDRLSSVRSRVFFNLGDHLLVFLSIDFL